MTRYSVHAAGRVSSARVVLVTFLAAALLTACSGLGPRSITAERGSYIDVLAATDKQELLANIVRLKHVDPPVFLQVVSVSASPEFEVGVAGEIEDGGEFAKVRKLLRPNLAWRDRPTIVYTPLVGRQFANELLLPMGIRPFFLMLDNGFDFSVVARLMLTSVNGLSNARGDPVEERMRFNRAIYGLQQLIEEGYFSVGTPATGVGKDDDALQLDVAPGAAETPVGRAVFEALGLDPAARILSLRIGLQGNPRTLAINTRSVLAVMSYLSGYVSVLPEEESGVWPSAGTDTIDPLMQIHVSRTEPADADPVVFVNGAYYFLRRDDIRSRNTLYLLRMLFNLQAQAEPEGGSLQLTLPVR